MRRRVVGVVWGTVLITWLGLVAAVRAWNHAALLYSLTVAHILLAAILSVGEGIGQSA